ncbi:malate dehydrogenase (oxaloacetate-decarboxylating)(NADP+) [Kwoniella mangroviensis CBS 10435]|uniref:Malic enzyme n=1 Tax=Kwoniella mangroviensis CBS 10435 TaxID=1331196 RepID=A0A1B9IMH8_9TREE|nr:malate dehydrogenase (oxaloacetate-decarboxylating)(NADP+) [Kwoniella mangroviensis CBS 10435]
MTTYITKALSSLATNGTLTPPLTPNENDAKSILRSSSPHPLISPEQNLLRLKAHLQNLPTDLLKHVHLSKIRREDPSLYFSAIRDDLTGLAPIVYTPTVGEACQKYSHIYQGPEGLYLSIDDKDRMPEILAEYAAKLSTTPQILVVTDGSRILGLGDLGIGGMGISVGKLNLYVAGGGVNPHGCLPVVLDMGTNTESIRNDPLYIGLRRPRASLEEATEFMDRFMAAASSAFPNAVIQHEDFYSEAAFAFLDKYKNQYRMFNDDIEGTGSVILGGFMAAAKQASAASGKALKDHRVVFLGGGSAAVGVAKEMMNFFKMQGLTEDEARERFWLIDTKGLITSTRPDVVAGKLASHKKYFIRNDTEGKEYPSLADVVEYVKPTALVGLSTTFGAFGEDVVRRMADLNEAPIIFPLSNPTSKCELSFADALNWTGGKVVFASGSPYAPIERDGLLREPGQGNNFLVFPGIGFGALQAGAKRVTEAMITASAIALSEALNEEEKKAGLLYPRLDRIREVSARVAAGVVRKAQEEGVDTNEKLRGLDDQALIKEMNDAQWWP